MKLCLPLGLIALCVVWSASVGALSISPVDVWSALQAWWLDAEGDMSGAAHVWWHLRMPRIALALLVGAALGLSGALTQGLFRNPLADPGLLGVTAGSACAVAMGLVLFNGLTGFSLPHAWRPHVLPVVAFVGGLLACLALISLARWLTPGALAGLLLTGLAINAGAGAIIGLLTYLASDEQLRSLTFWTLGSVAGAQWDLALAMGVLVCVAFVVSWRLAPALDALALGEDVAGHVGVNLSRVRAQVVMLVALTCGAAVAWCGMIGFIGLLAPHLARGRVGPAHRLLLPQAMALGAGVLLTADTLARTVAMPAEVPVGIFTALVGAPMLVWLMRGLARQRGSAA